MIELSVNLDGLRIVMMMMVKMGGLEGTNRLRGRVGRPITPLHTSNPKPTLWSNLDGCA